MKKLYKQFRQMTLSEKESADMRADMLSYMQDHPALVRKSDPVRHNKKTGKHFPLFLLLNKQPMFVGIILAVVAAFSGGTAYAAQQSLPGDVLYPVKIHVNEGVQGALAIGDESEAAWQIQLAERRANEASTLATQGELSTELAADISARLEKHVEKAASLSAKLEAKGNLEAAANAQSRLEALLTVQQRVFEELDATVAADTTDEDVTEDDADETTTSTTTTSTDEEDKEEVEDDEYAISHILDALEHKASVQEEVRAKYAEKLSEQDEDRQAKTATQTKQVTESKITATEKSLLNAERTHGKQATARQAYTDALSIKLQADDKLSAGEYGDAFELYHKAQLALDRVKVFLRSKASINVDIDLGDDDDSTSSTEDTSDDTTTTTEDVVDDSDEAEDVEEDVTDDEDTQEDVTDDSADDEQMQEDENDGRDDSIDAEDTEDQEEDTEDTEVETETNVNVNL